MLWMVQLLTDPRTAFGATGRSPTAPLSTTTPPPPIMPPAEVVDRVRRLYRERIRDVRCLIPVIVGLTKAEVIAVLPQLVQLNDTVVKEVISLLLHGEKQQKKNLEFNFLLFTTVDVSYPLECCSKRGHPTRFRSEKSRLRQWRGGGDKRCGSGDPGGAPRGHPPPRVRQGSQRANVYRPSKPQYVCATTRISQFKQNLNKK